MPSDLDVTEPNLASECIHCRARLSSLERVVTAHSAQFLDQRASNARIERLLEQILTLITPGASRVG